MAKLYKVSRDAILRAIDETWEKLKPTEVVSRSTATERKSADAELASALKENEAQADVS